MTSSIQSGATARGGRARAHSSKSAPFAALKAAQRRFIDFTRGSRVADGVRMMVRPAVGQAAGAIQMHLMRRKRAAMIEDRSSIARLSGGRSLNVPPEAVAVNAVNVLLGKVRRTRARAAHGCDSKERGVTSSRKTLRQSPPSAALVT